jgi:DNA-binding Xre family transcriptional regulator
MRLDRYKLKQQMKKAGVKSLAEMAKRIDVAPQTLSAWFAGKVFSMQKLELICEVLNCTPNDVLTVERRSDDQKLLTPLLLVGLAVGSLG